MLTRIMAVWVLSGMLAPSIVPKAELKSRTLLAFQSYAQTVESQVRQRQSSAPTFLSIHSDEVESRLRRGGIVVQKVDASPVRVPGGLIHHWTGAVFVPNMTAAQAVAFMQDYNNLSRYYQPEVIESKLLARNGDNFQVGLKLRRHEVLTVTFDTVSNVEYGALDATHQWSVSHMDNISDESGADRGLLWRMNTYWRFAQTTGGVVLECEVVTLTRDIPTGLGWAVSPFLSSVPRESLEFTLDKTRQGMITTEKQFRSKGR